MSESERSDGAGRAASPRKGTILVVDDDRLVLASLTSGLSQAGYEVIDADNGDDAILLARKHRPDLALLDIRMEGKSGFDVAEYLRQYLRMPFMFLSAFSDDATVAEVKRLGAMAYLVKPLDIRQIVPAVEAAFAQIALRSAEAAPVAPPSTAVGGLQLLSMAVGVLMHRYSLDRHAALARIARQAEVDGVGLEQHAAKIVQAVELLAATSGEGRV